MGGWDGMGGAALSEQHRVDVKTAAWAVNTRPLIAINKHTRWSLTGIKNLPGPLAFTHQLTPKITAGRGPGSNICVKQGAFIDRHAVNSPLHTCFFISGGGTANLRDDAVLVTPPHPPNLGAMLRWWNKNHQMARQEA